MNAKAPSPLVQTQSGIVRGVASTGVNIYRGIPYAEPPVGSLRWRTPLPARSWLDVRTCDHFAPVAPQPLLGIPGSSLEPQSEDCLYLNIWAPAGSDEGSLPVMVWIHGGSLVVGSGSIPLYEGSRLAQRGVVVVSFNYRLGRLGFFTHPDLDRNDSEPIGNFGFYDQLMALRWVRDNIAGFGGDPSNVTIFGESAGGVSVQTLLTMAPQTDEPLFAKAICQSGGGNALFPERAGADNSAEATTLAWMERQAWADTSLEALRARPARQLIGTQGLTGIMIDGSIVTESPYHAFVAGRQRRLPLMIGWTSYEASLPILSESRARGSVGPLFDELAAALRTRDPTREASVDACGDLFVGAPARAIARRHASLECPAFVYRFGYLPVEARNRLPGVPHMGELPFVFGNFGALGLFPETEHDRWIADAMQAYWVEFARRGDPNQPGLQEWPRADAGSLTLLDIDAQGAKLWCCDPVDELFEHAAMKHPRSNAPDLD